MAVRVGMEQVVQVAFLHQLRRGMDLESVLWNVKIISILDF